MSILNVVGIKPYSKLNNEQAAIFSIPLRQKLERGDYAGAELTLVKSSDQNRERMIFGIANSENAIPLSAKWAARYPNSALANVLVGASLIVSGWKIRGSGYAENVDESAWAPFLNKLSCAEEPLHRAAQLDNKIADPYSWLIHAGLGQGASREDQYQLFIEATSRVPLHWPTYSKYFNVMTEKWGGSHKEMFAFVRQSTGNVPYGNILHCLIPAAYNDFALSMVSERGTKVALATLRQPQFAKEVATCPVPDD